MYDIHIRDRAYSYVFDTAPSGRVEAVTLCGANVRTCEIVNTEALQPTCIGCILVEFQNEAAGKKNVYAKEQN